MPDTYPNPDWQALAPAPVWKIFAGISAVPRPSGREEKIRAHVLAFAREYGITAKEDATGNVLLTAPGSPGCENAPITVLQAHLDMVCERNSATEHDFDKDPIRLLVDRTPDTQEVIVRADGTTLGADNGIGLALALAAATDKSIVHGPLEILCTVDEEVGLKGVKGLSRGFFAGKRLLNLDSEGDDTLTIGCAGGADTTLTWAFAPEPLRPGLRVKSVRVWGLRGGHSGGDIHKNLANANRILVRVLRSVEGLRLLSIQGGSKRNSIAREASALVAVPAESEDALRRATAEVQEEAVQEYVEAGCVIEVSDAPSGPALSPAETATFLTALDAIPHGVIMMEPEIPGLVRTSTNLATLSTEHERGALCVTAGCLSRSSSMPQLHDVVRQIEAVGRLAQAHTGTGNEYPGWKPDASSPLLAVCRRVYHDLFGQEPKVGGVHGGLECGILSEKADGLEMVSLGAKIEGAHSPDERVYVASLQKTWTYLTGILAELARG